MAKETIDSWATVGMKEFPFYHKGMTLEEFEEEREYFYRGLPWPKGYEPLWKQRERQKEQNG